MILSWMVYCGLLALLLGVAAAMLETGVHQRGWPVRGLWAGALAGSVLIPIAGQFLSHTQPAAAGRLPAPAPIAGAIAGQPFGAWLGVVRSPMDAVSGFDLDPWLLGFWIVASMVGAMVLAINHSLVMRRGKEWVRHEIDGREVWISKDTGPAVFGFIRGHIVVPGWLLGREGDERELVLAHEEEHIRAGDPLLLLGTLLVLLALPWNLPLWWQWRRLRQAVELDCDRRVLARGVNPHAYGRLLVDVTELGVAHRFVVAALAESPLFLEKRIQLMLATRPRRGAVHSAIMPGLASMLLIAACSMDQPANPFTDEVTLWISPGAYRLGASESQPLLLGDLPGALRSALAVSAAPTVLNVRADGDESLGYDVIMARIAACEAGVRQIEYEMVDIPATGHAVSGGLETIHVTEEISPPCTAANQEPDTVSAARPRAFAPAPETRLAPPIETERPAGPGRSGAASAEVFSVMAEPRSRDVAALIQRRHPAIFASGLPPDQALWIAVDGDRRVRKSWVGPNLYIAFENGARPRRFSSPGSVAARRAEAERDRIQRDVLHANVPEMSIRDGSSAVLYGMWLLGSSETAVHFFTEEMNSRESGYAVRDAAEAEAELRR